MPGIIKLMCEAYQRVFPNNAMEPSGGDHTRGHTWS